MKYLLTSNKCPHCKQVKKKLKKQLENGTVKELSIDEDSKNSDQAFDLIDQVDIRALPTLIECDSENKCNIVDL